MLRVFGGDVAAERRDRIVRVHVWAGRAFVALYLVLLVTMMLRARERGIGSALVTAHAVLGIALAPLLAVKVLIARRWKSLHKMLPPLGVTILVLAFTAAALGGLLAWTGGGDDSVDLAALPGRPEGRQALATHCGTCHSLSRPLDRARDTSMTADAWKQILGKMAGKAEARGIPAWTPLEADLIVEFLLAQRGTAAPATGGGGGGDEEGDDRGRGRGRGRGGR
jgi:hypothetical protein